MKEIYDYITTKEFILSLVVLVLGILFYFLAKKIVYKITQNSRYSVRLTNRNRTYFRLLKNTFKYVMIMLVVVLILHINGVNITSLVAGIGIASGIIGLAFQDVLKDIIMGFNIIVDKYFSVGDVMKIDDIEGKILEIGFKVTKMQDIYNQNIYVIANREISRALNISTQLDIDIPLPYEEKIEHIEEVLNDCIDEISHLKDVTSVEYKGLQEFGASAISYKLRLQVKPENKPQAGRDARRIIKLILDKNDITIPYTQIDIHTK